MSDNEGYIEFDNGFVIQYGVVKNVSLYETWHTITFPKPFENKVVSTSVSLSLERGADLWTNNGIHNGFLNGIVAPVVKGDSVSRTGMKIGSDLLGNTGVYGNIYWTAYGF